MDMTRYRWFRLVLLILYVGILIGVQLHTHAAGPDQLTAHCKSCHVSQTVYDAVQSRDLRISLPVLYSCDSHADALIVHELNRVSRGRSPPLF